MERSNQFAPWVVEVALLVIPPFIVIRMGSLLETRAITEFLNSIPFNLGQHARDNIEIGRLLLICGASLMYAWYNCHKPGAPKVERGDVIKRFIQLLAAAFFLQFMVMVLMTVIW